MLALLIKVRIDPANAELFEKLFNEFRNEVFDDEPGTLVYHLAKSPSEEGSYRAIEIYENEEARKAHSASEAFQAFRPGFVKLLLEPPSSERLEVVA
jgi:quinol monooxygenase YgiN